MSIHTRISLCACTLLLASIAQAQSPAAVPDVMTLKDGEKIIGHLEKSTDTDVTFKSDVLGEVTVPWAKIQELKAAERFAAITKGANLHKGKSEEVRVPVGTLSADDSKIQLSPAAPPAPEQTIPVASLSNLVTEEAFQKAMRPTSIFKGWAGAATAGLAITDATQKSQTYTATLGLVRAVPSESWIAPSSRTTFDLNEAYGKLSEPGSPDIKTSLFHADLGQDWYLSPRFYLLASAAWDHSFSQGLDLQQNYGGGIGAVLIKSALQELDATATVNYINQRFNDSALNQSLIGSSFGETYSRKLPHKIVLLEALTFTPAWNNSSAYSASGTASLTFPVYHRFGLTIGTLDNFLNDPPPGFRKNSYQLTVGATYSFQ